MTAEMVKEKRIAAGNVVGWGEEVQEGHKIITPIYILC